jgi:hypothetical protein
MSKPLSSLRLSISNRDWTSKDGWLVVESPNEIGDRKVQVIYMRSGHNTSLERTKA